MFRFFCCGRKHTTPLELLTPLLPATPEEGEIVIEAELPSPHEESNPSTPIVAAEDEVSTPPLVPPNSPNLRPRDMLMTDKKCGQLLDYLITHTHKAPTIFFYLQIQSQIVAPLKAGHFEQALANFCLYFCSTPDVFHYICNKLDIRTANIYTTDHLPYQL